MGLMFNLFAGKAAKAARAGEHLSGLKNVVREGVEHTAPRAVENAATHVKPIRNAQFGDVIPGAQHMDAHFNPEVLPSERVLNPESFNPKHSGVSPSPSPSPPKDTGLDRYLSEDHANPYKRAGAIAFNGATMGFDKNIASRIASSSVGAGIAGGIVGGVGGALFPNNIEYQGTVAPILKGAVAGVAIGAAHGAAGRLMKKYKPGEMLHDFANKTQSITGNWKTGGLIAGAVAMGTTNTNFTNPINRVQGV